MAIPMNRAEHDEIRCPCATSRSGSPGLQSRRPFTPNRLDDSMLVGPASAPRRCDCTAHVGRPGWPTHDDYTEERGAAHAADASFADRISYETYVSRLASFSSPVLNHVWDSAFVISPAKSSSQAGPDFFNETLGGSQELSQAQGYTPTGPGGRRILYGEEVERMRDISREQIYKRRWASPSIPHLLTTEQSAARPDSPDTVSGVALRKGVKALHSDLGINQEDENATYALEVFDADSNVLNDSIFLTTFGLDSDQYVAEDSSTVTLDVTAEGFFFSGGSPSVHSLPDLEHDVQHPDGAKKHGQHSFSPPTGTNIHLQSPTWGLPVVDLSSPRREVRVRAMCFCGAFNLSHESDALCDAAISPHDEGDDAVYAAILRGTDTIVELAKASSLQSPYSFSSATSKQDAPRRERGALCVAGGMLPAGGTARSRTPARAALQAIQRMPT